MHTTLRQTSTDASEADRREIFAWLDAFARAVRERDYERGKALFDPDVFAFGSRSAILNGLEQLAADQWNPIWDNTRGFSLQMDQMRYNIDGNTAWVAAPWHSQGCSAPDQWFDRNGRATYILARRNGRWLAVHSHHSLNPNKTGTR